MSDLLAKCDWDEDELHVHITEWPEVVYVWVDEKTMPYAPVVADVRSLQAENKRLRHELAMDTFSGLGEIEAYKREASVAARKFAQAEAESAKLRDQLEEQKCFAADLERDVRALQELVAGMWEFMTTPCDDYCERCVVAEECSERQDYDCCQWQDRFADRMRKLGVGL